MNMELPEALAVAAAYHLTVDIDFPSENSISKALYDAALVVISKEAKRVAEFHGMFRDLSGDNS